MEQIDHFITRNENTRCVCFNPIKPVLIGLIFSLSLFNFNLNGQTWFETYSSGEDHSIPIKYPGDDHHFFLLYSADNTDYERRIDNRTGATLGEKNLGESLGRIIKTTDGGYLKVGARIAGEDQQILATRLDRNGNNLWTKSYSPDPFPFVLRDNSTEPRAIELPSGDFVLAGSGGAPAPFATQSLIIRINPHNGDIIWQKFIGGVGRANVAFGVFPASDDGVFVQALAALGSSNAGQFLIKMDETGNTLWQEGPNPHPINTTFSAFFDISPTNDGGIAYKENIGDIERFRRLDKDGNEVWTNESATGFLRTMMDGSLVIFDVVGDAAAKNYQLVLNEVDGGGNLINPQNFDLTLGTATRLSDYSIMGNSDGSYTLAGLATTSLNFPFKPNSLFAWRTGGIAADCDAVNIEAGEGQIKITNLTAPIEIVEVYDRNWQQVFRCEGTDCGSEQLITGLSAGKHYVKVQFYDANWQSICRLDNVEVAVTDGGGCDPAICQGDINLFSQAAIDAFCGCEEIGGSLVIRPSEGTITSLLPLAGLRKVGGNLIIDGAIDLMNLNGLNDVEMTGADFVLNNVKTLKNINALAKLHTVGDLLAVEGCEELASLAGMQSLNTASRISIQVCPKLADIQALNRITALNSLTITLTGLKNLQGLNNLGSIGEGAAIKDGLGIFGNMKLISLEGLNNLRRVEGSVKIGGNSVLPSLTALQNLRFIDNREGTGDIALSIRLNDVLSDCCGITRMIDEDPTNGQIFGGDVLLEDNPAFCSSVAEILANCQDPPIASCDDVVIEGGDSQISIFGLNAPREIVEVYDPNWNLVFRCQGTDCGTEQTITGLSAGRHFVKVQFYDNDWKWICGLGTVEVEVGGGTGCNNPDYPAMAAFANTLMDQSNTINWDANDCDICNWTGVTCDRAGRVEKIELTNLPLRGTLAPEIGQLSALKVFIIESVVALSGSIPSEISNLSNLEILSIVTELEAPIGLEGGIPVGITQLTRLKSLTIQGNVFSEPIPANIGNLTNLEVLDLSYNKIPGEIPTSIGNLVKLHILKLEHNNLTGNIPRELGNLSQLKKLILGEKFRSGTFFFYGLNNLTGAIPSELGNLSQLEEIDFTSNPLSGTIPAELGQLKKIKRAIFQAFEVVRPTGRRDFGKLEGCFPPELSVWCDNGATVSFEGHLDLPYPTTKFPIFCDNIVNNPTDAGICPSSGNCDAINIQGGEGTITITGLTASNVIVDVFDINWNGVFRCVGQECSETEVITSLSSGTYRVNIQFFEADWTPICRLENELIEVGSNGTPSCEDVVVTDDNGAIDIAGLTAPIEIVRIFDLDNGWRQVFECNNDCEDSQTISGLTSQNYLVKVQMYTNNWGWICERNIEFSFAAGSRYTSSELSKMIQADKILTISPNPVRYAINLDTKNLKDKTGTIRVYNTYGELVEVFDNQLFNSFTKTIDVSSYENGLYYLSVKVKGLRMVTRRFVVESLR